MATESHGRLTKSCDASVSTGERCAVCVVGSGIARTGLSVCSLGARNGFVGVSLGLNPGALKGDCSAGDKAPGEAVLGLRKGLFDCDNGRFKPGEG